MRILNIIPSLVGGGAERQLNYLAPLLVRMGHEVHIVYYYERGGAEELSLGGVILHKLNMNSHYDPRGIKKMIWLIKTLQPDIVQTWILQSDIFGGIAALMTKTPWIIREPTSKAFYTSSWKNRLRFYLGSKADAVISNSSGGDQCWNGILPAQRRFIIRNGVPTENIERIACSKNGGNVDASKHPGILYVGRLSAEGSANKNLRNLIKSLKILRESTDFVAIICGDGPQRQELEQMVEQNLLQTTVKFTGYLNAKDVWKLMKEASVFVSLSAYEGCPNTVMEAMVCRVPIVVSDIPAHRELLDDKAAIFVNPQNNEETANALGVALKNKKIASEIANNAKEKTKLWSTTAMADNYLRIYKQFANSADKMLFHS